MRVIHRVSLVDEPERREVLSSLGIRIGTPGSPLVRILWFDIDESDPAWSQLRELIPKWNVEDGCSVGNLGMVHTEFTAQERDAAHYLRISPAWHYGYPQPEDDFGYLKATYDVSGYCRACGIGNTQIAPFRMKGEPKWGKKQILQLNWVFDEYFVQPKLWKDVFEPIGIGCCPVVQHRTGKELESVVQLSNKAPATSSISMRGYPFEVCKLCGLKKYIPITRGFFPAFKTDPSVQLCRTQEFFGSGGSAWNAIIGSSAVYAAIQSRTSVGVAFVPMKEIR